MSARMATWLVLSATVLLGSGCRATKGSNPDSRDVPTPFAEVNDGTRQHFASERHFAQGAENSERRLEAFIQKGSTTNGSPTSWWRAWGTEQLDALVDEALATHPSLDAQLARLEQAERIAEQVGALRLPSATLSASAGRQRTSVFGATVRQNTHTLGVDLSWEIDLWGRLRNEQLASLADVEQARALVAASELSLAGRVVRSYFGVVESERQLDIARRRWEQVTSISARIHERFQRGLRTALDAQLTDAELARAQATVTDWQRARERRRRQLEVLLGRYPDATIEVGGDFPALPRVPTIAPAELLRRRPDLALTTQALYASRHRELAARLDLLPRLVLGAGAGTSGKQLEDLFDSDFGFWNFVGGLTQPLFEGGRLQAEAARALAARDEALANHLEAVLTAYEDVESTLASSHWLFERQRALDAAVRESQAALTLSEERYFGGLIDIIALLEARQRYDEALTVATSNLAAQHDNQVMLYLALGGGYRVPQGDEPDGSSSR